MQPPTVSTPDLVALLEDRFRGSVGFRDQVGGVEGVPEKFVALEAGQELGLGDGPSCFVISMLLAITPRAYKIGLRFAASE